MGGVDTGTGDGGGGGGVGGCVSSVGDDKCGIGGVGGVGGVGGFGGVGEQSSVGLVTPLVEVPELFKDVVVCILLSVNLL